MVKIRGNPYFLMDDLGGNTPLETPKLKEKLEMGCKLMDFFSEKMGWKLSS